MKHRYDNHWVCFAFAALTLLFSLTALVKAEEGGTARVKSIVVTPHKVDDTGVGVELFVQVDFVEDAPADGTLKLSIVTDKDQPGEGQWKDGQPEQSFPYHAKEHRVEVRATIRIIKNGLLAIKGETAADEDADDSYYWMPVTVRK